MPTVDHSEHEDWLDDEETQRVMGLLKRRLESTQRLLYQQTETQPLERVRFLKGICTGMERCLRILEGENDADQDQT